MSGHSKWSTIKRKKGKEDEKRGRIFTKLIKEITVAARDGGDPDANPRLRTAIDAAKAANMPADNMERAIKKGTGELEGVNYETAIYEGYGPGGVAMYVECLTDNRNRTVSEVRHILTKNGGNMAEAGAVAWMFTAKGQMYIDAGKYDEETVFMEASELGAEDVSQEDNFHVVTTAVEDMHRIRQALIAKGIEVAEAEMVRVPSNTIQLDESDAARVLRMMDALEDNDDVQNVSSNFDISDEVMAKLDQ
jgi:YebC/PmpR family DNA-binding regulatory protein